jgi:hypothetical protein
MKCSNAVPCSKKLFKIFYVRFSGTSGKSCSFSFELYIKNNKNKWFLKKKKSHTKDVLFWLTNAITEPNKYLYEQ